MGWWDVKDCNCTVGLVLAGWLSLLWIPGIRTCPLHAFIFSGIYCAGYFPWCYVLNAVYNYLFRVSDLPERSTTSLPPKMRWSWCLRCRFFALCCRRGMWCAVPFPGSPSEGSYQSCRLPNMIIENGLHTVSRISVITQDRTLVEGKSNDFSRVALC